MQSDGLFTCKLKCRIQLPEPIAAEVNTFMQKITSEEIKLSDLKIGDYTVEDVLDGLKQVYSL